MLACCVFLVVGVLSYVFMVKERYTPGAVASTPGRQFHDVMKSMMSNMALPQTPIVRRKPRRLAKEVADAFAKQIRTHVLKPGAKLPTESEIMSEHGVSRTVVREAISGLQAAGFVETRHGIGTFVLNRPPASISGWSPKAFPPCMIFSPCWSCGSPGTRGCRARRGTAYKTSTGGAEEGFGRVSGGSPQRRRRR